MDHKVLFFGTSSLFIAFQERESALMYRFEFNPRGEVIRISFQGLLTKRNKRKKKTPMEILSFFKIMISKWLVLRSYLEFRKYLLQISH